MQGTDERYRLSVAFQVRPVMIVPGSAAAHVAAGRHRLHAPRPQTIIGRDGVADRRRSRRWAPRLDRVEPTRFEAGASLDALRRRPARAATWKSVLGDVVLTSSSAASIACVVDRRRQPGHADRRRRTTLSAGEMPLVVRRRLSPTRTRSSNLLAARLLPTRDAAPRSSAGDLQLQGVLLGDDTRRRDRRCSIADDGATVRLFDTVDTAANQQTLTVAGVAAAVPAGHLSRDPARQQPAGEGQPERGGAMTRARSRAQAGRAGRLPAGRARRRRARAVLAGQVTLRLRREVCWLWRERGLQGGADATGVGAAAAGRSRAGRARSGALRARQARVLRRATSPRGI